MSSLDTQRSASANIDALLNQIRQIAKQGEPDASPLAADLSESNPNKEADFLPIAPKSLQQAGISETLLEELICKFLLSRGDATGHEISDQVKLPYAIVEESLARLKKEQILSYIGQSALNDYVCRLSDMGRERALRYSRFCTYFGSAPVPLNDYLNSVKIQSLERQHPGEPELKNAFSDLLINEAMLERLGPAVNSGKGMFLYGYAGNGKTSIAERVTSAFGKHIWIPRSMLLDSDIVRIFDPMVHVEAPLDGKKGLLAGQEFDHRWVRIVRPTIVVGGELTMEHLEISYNPLTGISEAPVQLKSNCGTLVIDDFGRQRISITELLNRWIVPLEKRYDYLRSSTGKKIQLPFDQLVIFSTNLEPRDLVDDAFLRRIPYKIEVPNPTREEFTKLFEIVCPKMGFKFDEQMIHNLIEKHFVPNGRPFRNCHPRDLLLQIKNYCLYMKQPITLSDKGFDFACQNYFSVV
jgi:hypothetical protein